MNDDSYDNMLTDVALFFDSWMDSLITESYQYALQRDKVCKNLKKRNDKAANSDISAVVEQITTPLHRMEGEYMLSRGALVCLQDYSRDCIITDSHELDNLLELIHYKHFYKSKSYQDVIKILQVKQKESRKKYGRVVDKLITYKIELERAVRQYYLIMGYEMQRYISTLQRCSGYFEAPLDKYFDALFPLLIKQSKRMVNGIYIYESVEMRIKEIHDKFKRKGISMQAIDAYYEDLQNQILTKACSGGANFYYMYVREGSNAPINIGSVPCDDAFARPTVNEGLSELLDEYCHLKKKKTGYLVVGMVCMGAIYQSLLTTFLYDNGVPVANNIENIVMDKLRGLIKDE